MNSQNNEQSASFAPIRLNDLVFEQQSIRPFGKLSDFVCQDLPTSKHDLINALTLLPSRVDKKTLLPVQRDIALLDLKMLFVTASRHQSHDHIRDRFAQEIEEMNEIMGRPAVTQMTYQEIILDNPKGDLRVFTSGSIGDAEMRFYRGHQLIEDTLAIAIASLQTALNEPDKANVSLDVALQACSCVVTGMQSFMKDLSKDDFMGFKPFFDSNPYTGEKGPSGAFSAKVPHVDILLYGQNTPHETLRYLSDNKSYFPQADHYNALQSYYNGLGVIDVVKGRNKAKATKIGKVMLNFRRFHKGAVTKQIGVNAVGSAEGNDAVSYLDNRIAGFKTALQAHRPK